jgi:hypothetical protein
VLAQKNKSENAQFAEKNGVFVRCAANFSAIPREMGPPNWGLICSSKRRGERKPLPRIQLD